MVLGAFSTGLMGLETRDGLTGALAANAVGIMASSLGVHPLASVAPGAVLGGITWGLTFAEKMN